METSVKRDGANIAQTAISKFGSIDSLVNNAGAFLVKPFTDLTAEDFRSLVSTNLACFFFITQLAVTQMLSQGTGSSVTSLTGLTAPGATALKRMLFFANSLARLRVIAFSPPLVSIEIEAGRPRDRVLGQ